MTRFDPDSSFDDADAPSDEDLQLDVTDEEMTAILQEAREETEWMNAAERALQKTANHPLEDQ
jgi:hypothetical protein